jgi:hypothetical protein
MLTFGGWSQHDDGSLISFLYEKAAMKPPEKAAGQHS